MRCDIDHHTEVVRGVSRERHTRHSRIGTRVTRVDGAGGVETHRGGYTRVGRLRATAEAQGRVGWRDRWAGIKGSSEAAGLVGDGRIDETIAAVDRRATGDA